MHVHDDHPIIAAVSHDELAVHPVISLDTLSRLCTHQPARGTVLRS